MPLEIIRNDITKIDVDAIVNATDSLLSGSGGVDAAIHQAAGPLLYDVCRTLGGCEVGQAKITKAYELPAKYVIHTVGPIWYDGNRNEEALLADCYRNSLALAKGYNLESVAIPLIASGTFRFPKGKALQTAISVIGEFLLNHEMMVFLVVYDKTSFQLSEKLFSSVKQYIDDNYDEIQPFARKGRQPKQKSKESLHEEHRLFSYQVPAQVPAQVPEPVSKKKRSLDDVVRQMDETFSQNLLRLIDDKGMSDTDTYKKANIDRKHFSKIKNDIHYKPSKPTALAFAIALRLNLDETEDLLLKAGFALSPSSKFDIIIQYFIEEGNYNIFEINETLFAFDQNLLGS